MTTFTLIRQQASMMRDISSGSRCAILGSRASSSSNSPRSAMTPHFTTSAIPEAKWRGGSRLR